MGVVRGLSNINRRVEQDNAPRESGPKVNYLKLADGETVRLWFLQELDAGSPGYNEDAGLGFLAIEHQSPRNFKIRGLCSMDDEGRCRGCEKHQQDFKAGWRQKSRLYINVLVQRLDKAGNEVGEPEVAVLAQGNGAKSVTPGLIEFAGENGTITANAFKMKRTGSGQTDTSYVLTPGKALDERLNPADYDLFDLDLVVREVPYDEQDAFYAGNQQEGAPVAATSVDSDW